MAEQYVQVKVPKFYRESDKAVYVSGLQRQLAGLGSTLDTPYERRTHALATAKLAAVNEGVAGKVRLGLTGFAVSPQDPFGVTAYRAGSLPSLPHPDASNQELGPNLGGADAVYTAQDAAAKAAEDAKAGLAVGGVALGVVAIIAFILIAGGN